jgi:hypothetical protein
LTRPISACAFDSSNSSIIQVEDTDLRDMRGQEERGKFGKEESAKAGRSSHQREETKEEVRDKGRGKEERNERKR